MYTLFFTL